MIQDTAEPPTRIEARSVFANVLSLSGYVGLAVGLCLEAYRLYLVDSAIGMGAAPEWLALSRFSLVVGSVVVLWYGRILDDVFEGWLDLVVLSLVVGQWGVPVSSYLDATVGGPGTPYGFFIIACAGLYALVAVLVAINYVRRCWPSTSAATGWRTE